MHVQVGDLMLEAEWGVLSEHLCREEREGGREREEKNLVSAAFAE